VASAAAAPFAFLVDIRRRCPAPACFAVSVFTRSSFTANVSASSSRARRSAVGALPSRGSRLETRRGTSGEGAAECSRAAAGIEREPSAVDRAPTRGKRALGGVSRSQKENSSWVLNPDFSEPYYGARTRYLTRGAEKQSETRNTPTNTPKQTPMGLLGGGQANEDKSARAGLTARAEHRGHKRVRQRERPGFKGLDSNNLETLEAVRFAWAVSVASSITEVSVSPRSAGNFVDRSLGLG